MHSTLISVTGLTATCATVLPSHVAAWLWLTQVALHFWCRADDLQALDDASKLDPSNSLQMELMHQHFGHNMAAIDFWLNTCIIPKETQQYPQRLVGNAWHLADNPHGQVVGFSGTNDNHRLLPLQVKQHLEVDEPTLRATNGKMLAIILANPQYDTLILQQVSP